MPPPRSDDANRPGRLGWHWMLDAAGGDPQRLGSPAAIAAALTCVARELSLTATSEPQVHSDPAGPVVAGVLLISASHISLHALPAAGVLHADIFSCRQFDAARAHRVLQEAFAFQMATTSLVERGIPR